MVEVVLPVHFPVPERTLKPYCVELNNTQFERKPVKSLLVQIMIFNN